MKRVEIVDIKWDVEYKNQEEFRKQYYMSTTEERVERYKGGYIYIIFADELGIPYYFEVRQTMKKMTDGKILNTKQYDSRTIREKIIEEMKRREISLTDEGEIVDLETHIKKAARAAGYKK